MQQYTHGSTNFSRSWTIEDVEHLFVGRIEPVPVSSQARPKRVLGDAGETRHEISLCALQAWLPKPGRTQAIHRLRDLTFLLTNTVAYILRFSLGCGRTSKRTGMQKQKAEREADKEERGGQRARQRAGQRAGGGVIKPSNSPYRFIKIKQKKP